MNGFGLNQGSFSPDLDFPTFVEVCRAVGAVSVGIWSDRLSRIAPRTAGAMLADAGLSIAAVNRGGFFASDLSPNFQESRERTLREIEFCNEVGAGTLIIVPGGLPEGSKDLRAARARFEAGFSEVLPAARAAGVTLAIEPFNPALTVLRGVVNRFRDAAAVCRRAGAGAAVVLDIYHSWWDADLFADIQAFADLIAGYHLCDHRAMPRDLIFDRCLPGEGVADTVAITRSVLAAGYKGPIEVEVFSKFDLWTKEPIAAAKIYRAAFDSHMEAAGLD